MCAGATHRILFYPDFREMHKQIHTENERNGEFPPIHDYVKKIVW